MEQRLEEIVNWLEYRIYRDKQSGLTNTTTMYQSIVNLIKDQQKEINKLKHKKE